MRVLVVGTETAEASPTVQALRGAGHEIARCHEPDAPAFPCSAIDGAGCPLEGSAIDVAVVVGRGVASSTSAGLDADLDPSIDAKADDPSADDGARCALRRHLPLVAVGCDDSSPLAAWATESVQDPADVADAAQRASAAPLRRHEDAARSMFRATLDMHGYEDIAADASVSRHSDTVHVMLHPSSPVPPSVAEKASVRVVGAVTKLDPHAQRISVTVAGE